MINFTKKTLVVTLAILLAFGANMLLAAGTWTAAPASPPDNNVDAPLNVGATTQEKAGLLKAGGLWSTAGGYIATVLGVAMSDANFHGLVGLFNGKIGATAYCDILGAKCVTPNDLYNLASSTSNSASSSSDYSGKILTSGTMGISSGYYTFGPNKTFSITKTGILNISGWVYGANRGAGGILRASIVVDGDTCGWGELYRGGSSRDYQFTLACIKELAPGSHTISFGEWHENDWSSYSSYLGYYVVQK